MAAAIIPAAQRPTNTGPGPSTQTVPARRVGSRDTGCRRIRRCEAVPSTCSAGAAAGAHLGPVHPELDPARLPRSRPRQNLTPLKHMTRTMNCRMQAAAHSAPIETDRRRETANAAPPRRVASSVRSTGMTAMRTCATPASTAKPAAARTSSPTTPGCLGHRKAPRLSGTVWPGIRSSSPPFDQRRAAGFLQVQSDTDLAHHGQNLRRAVRQARCHSPDRNLPATRRKGLMDDHGSRPSPLASRRHRAVPWAQPSSHGTRTLHRVWPLHTPMIFPRAHLAALPMLHSAKVMYLKECASTLARVRRNLVQPVHGVPGGPWPTQAQLSGPAPATGTSIDTLTGHLDARHAGSTGERRLILRRVPAPQVRPRARLATGCVGRLPGDPGEAGAESRP